MYIEYKLMKYLKNRGVTIWYFLYFLFIICLVFSVGIYNCKNPEEGDIVQRKLFPGLDGWLITHFLAYIVVGAIWPKTFALSLFLGILWEIIEVTLGKLKPEMLRGVTHCSSDEYWWYGRIIDIPVNMLGFLCGKYVIRQYF